MGSIREKSNIAIAILGLIQYAPLSVPNFLYIHERSLLEGENSKKILVSCEK